MEVVPKHDAYL
jgi:hypothetical protein